MHTFLYLQTLTSLSDEQMAQVAFSFLKLPKASGTSWSHVTEVVTRL